MTDAKQLHLSYIGSHLIKTDSTQYMLLLYPVDPIQTANPDIYHLSGGHSFDLHWGVYGYVYGIRWEISRRIQKTWTANTVWKKPNWSAGNCSFGGSVEGLWPNYFLDKIGYPSKENSNPCSYKVWFHITLWIVHYKSDEEYGLFRCHPFVSNQGRWKRKNGFPTNI